MYRPKPCCPDPTENLVRKPISVTETGMADGIATAVLTAETDPGATAARRKTGGTASLNQRLRLQNLQELHR